MTTVNWLLERNIFDEDEQFVETLKKHNYPYKNIKYLDFDPRRSHSHYPDHACVLFKGTLNLGRNILRTSWIPGAYMNGKRSITREWRFFVYKNEIITGSLYLVGEDHINETIKGGYLVDYLTQVLQQVNWYPEILYCIDICESNGELYILELGSYSCAGEYGADLDLLVEYGAKAALEDFAMVND